MTKGRKRTVWALLGILTLFLLRLGKRHPEAVESIYGVAIFPAIRNLFDVLTGWLPFPAISVVVVLVIILVYRTVIIPLRHKNWTWRSLVSGIVSTAGAIVFLFYCLWGFNYGRYSIADRMGLEGIPLDSAKLISEFRLATDNLVYWVDKHESAIRADLMIFDSDLEGQLHAELVPVLDEANFPSKGMPRGRLLKPKGILLRFDTAGIYIPFSGEGHVDGGMLPVQVPYTMSHELAHGYGVTDEGECNFLAYLACSRSEDPAIRFSGLIGYWRYVAFDVRRHFPEDFDATYDSLPELVRETMTAIYINNKKYPSLMPRVRNAVYDSYLKSNGIADGLVSYNRVVRLVHEYRKRQY